MEGMAVQCLHRQSSDGDCVAPEGLSRVLDVEGSPRQPRPTDAATRRSLDIGSVSVANSIMYAGSNSGQMYALDTITGKILWNFASGGAVIDGPSIADGVVYWGSGYRSTGIGNNKVYAFTLAGSEDGGDNSKRGQK
jgi:outer membrane protein assembly factor BamB